ncbi:MAG: hypothetical protein ACLU6W_11245 [Lachnospiraceae bacterium]|nr:hypothetical protein [Candidatus Fimimorpha excrementavium]
MSDFVMLIGRRGRTAFRIREAFLSRFAQHSEKRRKILVDSAEKERKAGYGISPMKNSKNECQHSDRCQE